jgi:hypothetical protein
MQTRKVALAGVLVGLLMVACGCASVTVGTQGAPVKADVAGLASAYVGLNGIRPYDKEIFRLGILSWGEETGEIVSFDLWPVVGAGVGIVGARVHVFWLEAGAGVLLYQPEPRSAPEPKEEES